MENNGTKGKREGSGVRKYPCLREVFQKRKITLLLVPYHYNKKDRSFCFTLRTLQSTFQGGFTLIEIIVVIVLAGLILAAIVVPFTTGIRQSTKPEMVATAMYLAHQQMEALMEFNYCQGSLSTGTYTTPPPPITGYTWTWTISYVTSTFATSTTDVGYKEIVVTVTDPQGSTYSVYSVVTRF
jgi:prepilin-type N-terminal cleavage/methylation domain-containing protein